MTRQDQDLLESERSKRNAAMIDLLGLDQSWTHERVLERLVEAAEHLLHDHDCDFHGHEEIAVCIVEGKRYAALVAAAHRKHYEDTKANMTTSIPSEPKPHSIIDHPDVIDLKIEATLCQLLEDTPAFALTLSGRQLFRTGVPKSLYDHLTMKHIVSEMFKEDTTISIILWMERFLAMLLDDPVVYPMLRTVDDVWIAKADEYGIRTRTFEMLLGTHILETAEFRALVRVDRNTMTVEPSRIQSA
ncbi:MAG: hypothetical protein NTX72_04295 [Candidatus Uhrbacteria bacterium]|nr:hypothetical protein [Candidatus Uhrbacteria bacterium]